MTKFKIVYTISDNEKMESDLRDSIDSALEFMSPNDIIVISTPPHDFPFLDSLKEKANLDIRLKNYTEAWRLHPSHLSEQPKRYGVVEFDKSGNVLSLEEKPLVHCHAVIHNKVSLGYSIVNFDQSIIF